MVLSATRPFHQKAKVWNSWARSAFQPEEFADFHLGVHVENTVDVNAPRGSGSSNGSIGPADKRFKGGSPSMSRACYVIPVAQRLPILLGERRYRPSRRPGGPPRSFGDPDNTMGQSLPGRRSRVEEQGRQCAVLNARSHQGFSRQLQGGNRQSAGACRARTDSGSRDRSHARTLV
jgi:hypothetical protein